MATDPLFLRIWLTSVALVAALVLVATLGRRLWWVWLRLLPQKQIVEKFQAEMSRTPMKVTLQPTSDGFRSDLALVSAVEQSLVGGGFVAVGTFRIPELAFEIRLRLFFNAEECCYAAVSESPRRRLHYDIWCHYESGQRVIYTTIHNGGLLPVPNRPTVCLPRATPQELFGRFLAERPREALEAVSAETVGPAFVRGWAETMEWRRSRKLTPEDAGRILAAGPVGHLPRSTVRRIREQARSYR